MSLRQPACPQNAIGLGETIQAAASRMKERGVSTLVVVDGRRLPIGVLTDRAIVVRILSMGRISPSTRIEEVMADHLRRAVGSIAIPSPGGTDET